MFSTALLLTVAIQIHTGCNSDFFQAAWQLLKDARYGQDTIEQAAFALRDRDGHVWFARWPASASHPYRADYVGAIPTDTFAIVHTHPNRSPIPSVDDSAVAQRLGIPVIVVTRMALYRTTGRRIELLARGDWNPERCTER